MIKQWQSDGFKIFIYGTIADIITTFIGWIINIKELNPAGFSWVFGVNVFALFAVFPLYKKFMQHKSYNTKARIWVDRVLYGIGMFKIVIATLNFIQIVVIFRS